MNKVALAFFLFFFSSYHSFAQQSWIYSNNFHVLSWWSDTNVVANCNTTLFRVNNDTLEAGFLKEVGQLCEREYKLTQVINDTVYLRFSFKENPTCLMTEDDWCVTLKIMPCDSFSSLKVWLNHSLMFEDSVVGLWYQVTNNGNCNISYSPIFPVGLKELIWEIQSSSTANNITWSTIEEKNVRHFEIEKSYDSKVFETINIVNSKGDGSHNYSVADAVSVAPVFYRIKTVDIDGKFSLSDIKSISNRNKDIDIKIYPNPATDNITIHFKDFEDAEFEMYVTDITGRKILQKNISVYSKDYICTNDVNGITNGYYVLHLRSVEDGTSFVYPFIIK